MSQNTVQHERHSGSGQDLVEVVGSFVTAGAAAPTVPLGRGYTVSAPTAGVYSITLDRRYAGLASFLVDLGQASASANDAQPGTYDPATGILTLITESTAGTGANLTGPTVYFVANMIKYETQL